tara:strand:- start:166 stop:378 length:213 start_codon:yes stop_codon:yes gene_type:complete
MCKENGIFGDMRFEEEDIAKMVRVNNTMKAINTQADNIYDALMDEEYDDLIRHLQRLTAILRKLNKKYKD